MPYVQFDTLAHIQAAAQAIGATPAIAGDGAEVAVAVWYAFDAATSMVTPSQGADGTYLFSTFYWGQACLDWWDAQAFAGYLGSGLEDHPAGWAPYAPPIV